MDILNILKELLREPRYTDLPDLTKRIILKEYLIKDILAFIYRHGQYRKLSFYGGTCARVVYGLNRLSEDIDLDNVDLIDLSNFADEVMVYLENKWKLKGINVYVQHGETGIGRWTVRVPELLSAVGLSPLMGEKLHVKVEISSHAQVADRIVSTVMYHGESLSIRHVAKPSLMAGKMIACIERVFRKGKTEALVKGRDWYDLWWYLNGKVVPNDDKLRLDGEKSYTLEGAWKILDGRVKKLQKEDLVDDLRPFFTDQDYVESWLNNFQDFYRRGRA